jgi:hypothetical protein
MKNSGQESSGAESETRALGAGQRCSGAAVQNGDPYPYHTDTTVADFGPNEVLTEQTIIVFAQSAMWLPKKNENAG